MALRAQVRELDKENGHLRGLREQRLCACVCVCCLVALSVLVACWFVGIRKN